MDTNGMTAMRQPRLSVMLAHRSELFRAELGEIIQQDPCLTLIAEANTAQAALDLFLKFQPDVALVDMRLPDKSGFEVAQYIRQIRPTCFIILMTAASDPFVNEVGRMLGVTAICDQNHELGRVREALKYVVGRRS